ncbi:hypothetical protein M8J77_014396 [Diaphorina citri]|nr:hypothetical protein M8J77_014396 [Diaphorina citri]
MIESWLWFWNTFKTSSTGEREEFDPFARQMMNASYIRLENVTHAQTSPKTPMYLTVAGIELEITSFQVGKLKIQCQAEVFQYKSVKKIVLDEERPQLAQVLGTRTSSSANIVLNMEPMTLLLWSALQILLISWSTR